MVTDVVTILLDVYYLKRCVSKACFVGLSAMHLCQAALNLHNDTLAHLKKLPPAQLLEMASQNRGYISLCLGVYVFFVCLYYCAWMDACTHACTVFVHIFTVCTVGR